eukprot:m.218715 g.218715  ORF g.218715 m.218715 type:complete len:678 (-) comp10790_c1_seq1:3239-5272(-)
MGDAPSSDVCELLDQLAGVNSRGDSGDNSDGDPGAAIAAATAAAHAKLGELQRQLAAHTPKHVRALSKEDTATVAHLPPVTEEELSALNQRLLELSHLSTYRDWLALATTLTESLTKASAANDVGAAAIPFRELSLLKQQLSSASCSSLRRLVQSTLSNCHEKLTQSLTKDLRAALDKLGWPNEVHADADLASFQTAFVQLVSFQAPDSVVLHPVAVMMEPIVVRFLFHFRGDCKTNRGDRLDWAFRFILDFMERHDSFISKKIQPLLNKELGDNRSAKAEFLAPLLVEIRRKLEYDLDRLEDFGGLRAALLQILAFDVQLQEFGVGSNCPGSQSAFLDNPDLVQRWIDAGRHTRSELLTRIFSGADTWIRCYADLGEDLDEFRVPLCVEMVLNEAKNDVEVLSNLGSHSTATRFAQELNHPFLETAILTIESHASDAMPAGQPLEHLCRVLNGTHYFQLALLEWSYAPFWLNLESAVTSYDDFVVRLQTLEARLIRRTSEFVTVSFKAAASGYFTDRAFENLVDGEVTPALRSGIRSLQRNLCLLQDEVAPGLYPEVLRAVVEQLESGLLRGMAELSLGEVAVQQLVGDLKCVRSVFPPEAIFSRLPSLITLLTLSDTEWLRIHELLSQSTLEADALAALAKHGISPELTCNHSRVVLAVRQGLCRKFGLVDSQHS